MTPAAASVARILETSTGWLLIQFEIVLAGGNAPLAVESAKRSIVEAGLDESRRDMTAVEGLIEACKKIAPNLGK